MKKIRQLLALSGIMSALMLPSGILMAQGGGGGGGFGGPGGGGNFDPAEMQRMMMDNLREQLEVKDAAEWKVLEGQIQKVMDARREANAGGGGRGMFGMGGPGGRQGGGGQAGNGPGGGGGGGRGGRGPVASPEADALRKAVDAKASNDELKAAVAKVVAARKQKQAALEQAQGNLQKLLSTRQEAIAYTMGLL